MSAAAAATRTFSDAHRLYVKSLYRRYLINTLNWAVRRDLWREKALEVRAEFERHRLASHNMRHLAVAREEGP
jgi:NADH dehydrogenase (ubiquinone) 1 beta subcomplex subunit 9